MKTCPKCQTTYPDEYAVCTKDGAALEAAQKSPASATLAVQPVAPGSQTLEQRLPTPLPSKPGRATPAASPRAAPARVIPAVQTEEPWWMVFDFLAPLGEPWESVSRPAILGWLIFYGIFLAYAFATKNNFLIADYVFLPIHEGGHLLFGWLGYTIGIAGGTLLQLGAPLAIALTFAFRRQLLGTSFAAFFFFENFLNVSVYMADARAQALPLVTVANAETVEHDWNYIFTKLGLLQYDIKIAGLTRFLGWLGMLGVVVWLAWKARTAPAHTTSFDS